MQLYISVVIPALNEEKYLPKCLESLKRQTYRDFEVIVSDGGSLDQTVNIAKKYQAFVVIDNQSNVVGARQTGMEKAKGEIIVCADADTYYPPNYLSLIVEEYKKDKKTIAVTGKAQMISGPTWSRLLWSFTYTFIELMYKLTGKVLYAPAFNLSFRKEVFEKLGGYNTKLDFGGDELDVLARLKKKGRIVYNNKLFPTTSGRRYNVGFLTFIFKHMFYYYWLNYISAKYFKKQLIRAKPVR